jgi:hypothetical protein
VLRLAEDIGSSSPQVFGGNLDPARAKTRIARWVASSDLAGDYRNWDQIRDWADEIGRQFAERAAWLRRCALGVRPVHLTAASGIFALQRESLHGCHGCSDAVLGDVADKGGALTAAAFDKPEV